MKKSLPRIYRGNVSKGCSNNRSSAYGYQKKEEDVIGTINRLFKQNQIYREEVILTTKDKTINTKIIGRTNEHVITIDNTIIKIDDIQKLEIKK